MEVKKLMLERGRFKVQDRAQTRFWEDVWIGQEPLMKRFPSLYNIMRKKNATVAQVLSTTPLNVSFRRALVGDNWARWLQLVGSILNVSLCEQLYLSILSPARPGLPMNVIGRAWAEILKPAKKHLARARPEMLFLVVLHYKMCGRPAQARAQPDPKIKARCVQWDGHGQDFFRPEITEIFFSPSRNRPGPKNAQVYEQQDSFIWTSSKCFSVKAMYKDLMVGNASHVNLDAWKAKIPLKIKIFFGIYGMVLYRLKTI
jgi:hypothetical protein